MIQINSADFRASMASYLDQAYNGEQVMITRKNQIFLLMPVSAEELVLSPQFEARLAEARKDIAEGKGLRFDDKDKLDAWLESL